jgi:hypothetical protein
VIGASASCSFTVPSASTLLRRCCFSPGYGIRRGYGKATPKTNGVGILAHYGIYYIRASRMGLARRYSLASFSLLVRRCTEKSRARGKIAGHPKRSRVWFFFFLEPVGDPTPLNTRAGSIHNTKQKLNKRAAATGLQVPLHNHHRPLQTTQ